MQKLQKQESYEKHEKGFLKNPEELEKFGYEVRVDTFPELQHYYIRKESEYYELKVHKDLGTIEISFDGHNFHEAGIGLDIYVNSKNWASLIYYFKQKSISEDEDYEKQFLKNPEELEKYGYEVRKEFLPEFQHYYIRKGFVYVELKIYENKGMVEISFDGNAFQSGIGLDIFVNYKNEAKFILYYKDKCRYTEKIFF